MNNRIISILLLLAVIFVSSIWGLSKSQQVMTGAQGILREELSNALGSLVSVGDIELTSYNTITIHNTIIYDKQTQPLMSSEKIMVTYSPLIVLQGQAVVESISRVAIEKPTLHLAQASDGRWNVEELFQQENTGKTSFGGTVQLVNGSGTVTSGGTTWNLENLRGSVDFSNKPTIDLDLEAVHKGADLTAKGSINSQKRSHISIGASELFISDFQKFLPEGSFKLIGGSLKKLDVAVSQEQGQLQWAGVADLAGIGVEIDDIPVRQVEGNVVFNNKSIYLSAEALVAQQPVGVHGSIRIDTAHPILNLIVSSEKFDSQVIGENVPVTGELAFEAAITGISTNPIINGKVDFPVGKIGEYEVRNAKAMLQVMNKKVTINQSSGEMLGGTVGVTGVVELTDHSYQLQLKAQEIDMAYVDDVVSGSRGRGNGDISIKGIGNPATADIQGTITMGQGEVAGVPFDFLSAGFYRHGDQFVLDYGTIHLAQGLVTGQGKINGESIQLAVYGENLSLGQLFPQEIGVSSGSGNFSGQITGTLSQPEFTGHFVAINGQALYQPFAQLKGGLQVNKERVSLKGMELIHGVTKHEIEGTIALSGEHEANLVVRTHQARAENIVALLMPGEKLTGNVDNELTLTGPLANLNAEGQILLTNGSFRGQLVAKAQGSYKRIQGATIINQMSINSLNTRIHLSGSISPQNELNFDITAKNLNLKRLNIKLPYDASGRAAFAGKLTGTLDAPAFKGQLSAEQLTLNNQNITDVTGEISFHDQEIEVPSVSFNQGAGKFNFSGGFGINTSEIYGKLSVVNAELQSALAVLNIANKDMQGIVNGEVLLNGTVNNPSIWLTGIVKEGRMKQYPVESVKIDVALENNLLTIRDLSATQGTGILVAQGTADLNGPIAMDIGGRDIDAGFVASFFDTTVKPEGKMGFAAQITGETKNPHAAISLEIANGGIGSANFDSLYGLLIVDKKMIHVNQVLLKKGAHQASAYGIIPIAALNPIGRQQATLADQMDLKIRLDEADLSILPFFTKEVGWADGKTHGEMNVTGTLAEPSITGGITVNNGTIKLASLTNPIQKVGVDIRFEGDTISLKQFDGSMGKGLYSLTGTAKLRGLSLTDYNLTLVLNKPELQSKYFKGSIDGQLQMNSVGNKPKISGALLFENDVINIPALPELEASLLDLDLDIGVTVGKKVRFYNPFLYDILAEGHLQFSGSTREPNFSGQIVARRGTVNYLRTQFKVNEASVEFTQFSSFEPIVKLEAQTRLQQVLVNLDISGPINAMQFSLTSEPAMRQQEIISLLTLRSSYADKQNSGTAGTIGKDEVFSILGAGLQMQFMSGIENRFQTALGLDSFKLVQDTTSTTVKKSYNNIERTTSVSQEIYNIEMSKYLSDKLLLTYTVGLDNDTSDLGLSYTLSKRTSLNASIDEKNRTWVGFETRFKF